jgi:succinate dehydrogenase/fumarate reductase flavoprotein subunit
MLLVAQSVAQAALARTESRGAHQREDYPGLEENWCVNHIISLSQGDISLRKVAPTSGKAAA